MDHELEALRELELSLLDPAVRADAASLTRLLHPDFVEFGASGNVWTRDSVIDALVASPATPVTAVLDLEVCRVDTNTALVTFRAVGPTATALRVSVWLRDDDGWRVRFHQGTRVEP